MSADGSISGSDLHYASLYATPPLREQFNLVNALQTELCSIPMSVSDTGVARVKLGWWHGEAQRLVQGNPSHTLTRNYANSSAKMPDISAAMCALIAGLDEELGGRILTTNEDRRDWFNATFSPINEVRLAIGGECDGPLTAQLLELGRWVEVGYSLLFLKPHAMRQIRRLAIDELEAKNCSWNDIESGRESAVVVALLGAETQVASDELSRLLNAIPRVARRTHLPLITLGRIVQDSLIEMRKDGCRIWLHRIELTPLRKLWLAWRTRYW
jgi:phytoene synthase